jgi:hypothetical protein
MAGEGVEIDKHDKQLFQKCGWMGWVLLTDRINN